MKTLSTKLLVAILATIQIDNVCGKKFHASKYKELASCGENWVDPLRRNPTKRLIGGYPVYEGEFPSVVYIHTVNCAAVLLTPRWMITTASCEPGFLNRPATISKEWMANWVSWGAQLDEFEDDRTELISYRGCTYDFYRVRKRFDFSVHYLSDAVRVKKGGKYNNVSTICFPKQPIENTTYSMFAVGFGASGYNKEEQSYVYPRNLSAIKVEFDGERGDSNYEMKLKPVNSPGGACSRDLGDPIIGLEEIDLDGQKVLTQVLRGIVIKVNEPEDCRADSNTRIVALDIYRIKDIIIDTIDMCVDFINDLEDDPPPGL